VTVRLWKGEKDSIIGEVFPPHEAIRVEMAIPVAGPRSPAEALAVAAVLSRRLNCDIVVVDNKSLWNPAWGALV
jgi:hypothetical protein